MSKPPLNDLKDSLLTRSQALGFELFGVAGVGPYPEHAFFNDWIEQGHHAGMDYLRRRAAERGDLLRYFPQGKRVLCFGMVYARTDAAVNDDQPHVALYARGKDYHDVMSKRLEELAALLREAGGVARVCVDTAPVLERAYALHAGLGWIGKNTLLLNRDKGSWFLLGEILTDLEIPLDQMASAHCGSCTRCLNACPTKAFPQPYVLDARRCISYWTIEHRGEIPDDLHRAMGAHLFGCDICQQVCPWNQHGAGPAGPIDAAFLPLQSNGEFLENILSSTPENFATQFAGSPVQHAHWLGLVRNAALVIGNRGWKKYRAALERLQAVIPQKESWAKRQIAATLARLEG